ncbi:MAG: flagellar protein FlgN [Dechloromonas sp.]|nr:MAG: flagellar protein FlgN [Dechloromonas sp.]
MADIAAITEREVALIARFVDLLKEEQESLRRADPTALPDLGAAKITLVEQLNGLENERRSALGVADEEKPRAAMDKWLAANPTQRAAAINWKKVLELAEEARQLHQLNAGLVALHLQQTNEALAVVNARPQSQTLYGSDGQAATASGSRIVDSA